MADHADATRPFDIEELIRQAWAPKPAPPAAMRRPKPPSALSPEEQRELAFALARYFERSRIRTSQID